MSESKSDNNRHRLIALFATVAFHVLVVVVLLTLYLRYPGEADEARTWPPVDSSEVLFGGEYVMIGDRPEIAENTGEPAPAEAEAQEVPAPEAEALVDAGEPAEPAPLSALSAPLPPRLRRNPLPKRPDRPRLNSRLLPGQASGRGPQSDCRQGQVRTERHRRFRHRQCR